MITSADSAMNAAKPLARATSHAPVPVARSAVPSAQPARLAIDDQLERWHLSAAEKEVALLLLKGLEHKEIAQLREVAETTVRQQARSLYRKAGLAGRHELAAFFLEDLLGPRTHEARAGAAPSSAP